MLAGSEDETQPDSILNNEIFDLKIYKTTFSPNTFLVNLSEYYKLCI